MACAANASSRQFGSEPAWCEVGYCKAPRNLDLQFSKPTFTPLAASSNHALSSFW
jgi:hypothetical protein